MITRSKLKQASKQATCSNESSLKTVAPIWSLSDDLLSKIFSYLNANERFRLAEVCTRWAGVTRMDWTDITCLDLSSIPAKNIGPIIRLCPKLVSITAQNRIKLDLIYITKNLRGELTTLSLYRVFAYDAALPGSLKRLRLDVDFLYDQAKRDAAPWFTLDCLILEVPEFNPDVHDLYDDPFGRSDRSQLLHLYNKEMPVIFRLRQLRELRLLRVDNFDDTPFILENEAAVASVVSELNRLEVLCFDFNFNRAKVSVLAPLFTSHPTLRILIITGASSPIRRASRPFVCQIWSPLWSITCESPVSIVESQKSGELASANQSATSEELFLNASGAPSNGVGTPSKSSTSAAAISSGSSISSPTHHQPMLDCNRYATSKPAFFVSDDSPPSTTSDKSADAIASQQSLELGSANHSATSEELLLNESGALSNDVGTPSKSSTAAASIGSDLGDIIDVDEDEVEETLIPPRRRYPNGLSSDPLPFLHVFIGGTIAQKIRFATPLDAMEIHPITLPMPAFLEQPEIAEIFKGSWIGEVIKESAKSNAPLWDYDARTADSFLIL